MVTKIPATDAYHLRELSARYVHVIDNQMFPELATIFTADAVFDATRYGRSFCVGVGEIIDMMTKENDHPVAHHTTDLLLEPRSDDSVRLVSKGLAVLRNGRVHSLVYDDVAVRGPDGWRLATRTAIPVRHGTDAAEWRPKHC